MLGHHDAAAGVAVDGIVDDDDPAQQPTPAIVLEPNARLVIADHHVVAHDHGTAADHDAGGAERSHHHVGLDHRDPVRHPGAVDHDAGTLGVHDHVPADHADRVELDLEAVADLRITRAHPVDLVFLDHEAGDGAGIALMAAEVHAGGFGPRDDVPPDHQAVDAAVGGRHPHTTEAQKPASLDGDAASGVNPESVLVPPGGPQVQSP